MFCFEFCVCFFVFASVRPSENVPSVRPKSFRPSEKFSKVSDQPSAKKVLGPVLFLGPVSDQTDKTSEKNVFTEHGTQYFSNIVLF